MTKLIVADDDPEITSCMKEMLSPFYLVDTASSGSEVIKLAEKGDYGGLIIDVDFGPGISGLEVASILRSNNKEIKIVIFSAIDYSDSVRQQAVDIGADFFIKPISLDSIRRILERG